MSEAIERDESSPPCYYEPLRIPALINPYTDGGKDFNPDWLPPPYGELVKRTAQSIQINVSAVAAAFLGAVSIALNGRLLVTDKPRIPDEEPEHYEAGQLWYMVALPTGERKSSCMNRFIEPIRDWVYEQNKSRTKRRKSLKLRLELIDEKLKKATSQQKKLLDDNVGLQKWDDNKYRFTPNHLDGEIEQLRDEREELEEQLRKAHFITLILQDTTPEAAGQALSDNNGRVSFADSEGGIFDTIGGRYSNGKSNFDVFLHGFDNEWFSVNRKTSDRIEVQHACMSALYFVQPRVVKAIFDDDEMIEKGFAGRFICIKPPIMSGIREIMPPRVPKELKDAYTAKIRELLEFQLEESDSKAMVYMDDEAREKGAIFNAQVEAGMDELEIPEGIHDLMPLKKSGFAHKLFGKTKRTALLLKMLEDSDTDKLITGEMMDRAINITWWYVDHAEAIHGNKFVNDNKSLERQLIERMKDHPDVFGRTRSFTLGELSKFASAGGFRSKEPNEQKRLLIAALQTLKEWNVVSPSIEVNRKTGETKWIANEAIFEWKWEMMKQ